MKDLEDAAKQVENFNRDYPVGTRVTVRCSRIGPVETFVCRPAMAIIQTDGGYGVVAWFADIEGYCAIDRVSAVAE